jgi:MFS family permease
MVKDFHMGNGSNASFYAGVLISAFSLAEALTGMFWGGVSDRLGRKPILLSGSVGTMASLILVGIAPNFWVAVAARALGGALNGNIGVIQTMVGELVKQSEHEREYSVLSFHIAMLRVYLVFSSSICYHAFCLVNRNDHWTRYGELLHGLITLQH